MKQLGVERKPNYPGRLSYSTDLRETTNRYVESDVSIYTQAVFREEVFNKMTSEQKIRLIFELKEKGLAEMEEAWEPSIETFELKPVEEDIVNSRKKRADPTPASEFFLKKHVIVKGSDVHNKLIDPSTPNDEILQIVEEARENKD